MGPSPRGFDDQAAWLTTHTKTAVVELLRVTWPAVGAIAARVVAEGRALRGSFDGLEGIGFDEISCGQKYLMVVVDHDTVGWCGRPTATL